MSAGRMFLGGILVLSAGVVIGAQAAHPHAPAVTVPRCGVCTPAVSDPDLPPWSLERCTGSVDGP